jgi:hypothetical protein
LLPCEGLRLGVRIQTDLDKHAVTQRTAFGAKPSSSKPDADRRSTQLDPLDFAFGESRLRVKVRPMIPLSPGRQSSG